MQPSWGKPAFPGPHRAKPHRLITASDRARYGPPPRPAGPCRRAGATRNTHSPPEFLRRLGRRGGRPTSASQISSATLRRTAPAPSCEPECPPGAARPSTAPSSTGGSATAATAPSPPQIGSAALRQPAAFQIDLPRGRPPPPASLTQSPPRSMQPSWGRQSPPGPHRAKPYRLITASDRARYGPPPRPAGPGRRAGATRNTRPPPSSSGASAAVGTTSFRPADRLRYAAPNCSRRLLRAGVPAGCSSPARHPELSTGGSVTAATATSPPQIGSASSANLLRSRSIIRGMTSFPPHR
jgi:hypothetical protein